jgi:hypothetical protein
MATKVNENGKKPPSAATNLIGEPEDEQSLSYKVPLLTTASEQLVEEQA